MVREHKPMGRPMTTYNEVNGKWPEPMPVPTAKEAIAGTRRLIRRAFALAASEGVPCDYGRYIKARRFKITSGRRVTWCRGGTWVVNPDEKRWGRSGGWGEIVHSVSHWAHRRFWPKEKPHAHRHVWLENELTDFAVANFLAGQLARPETPKPDPKAARAARVAARLAAWEAKARRAENALRKLRRQARYYGVTVS